MRRIAAAAVALTLAGAAAWGLWPRPGQDARGGDAGSTARHLVLVTVDTLRADRLTPARMPRTWQWAAGGRRFSNARTTAPLTLPAHASIMTGLLPPAHGVRENGVTLDRAHPTLASRLRAAGFRTGAFVSAFVLDPQFGLAEGFETYDASVPRDERAPLRLEAERPGRDTVDAALAWLRAIDPSRDRVFLWVHLFEPHAPYPDGYDRDVAEADAQIARVIRAAEQLTRTAVIIAGDHGESLGSHGETTHGMLVYDSALRVPLVLRGPGVVEGDAGAPVSLADVAATALRWTGVASPGVQGVDLRGDVPADRDVYSETMYPRAAGWHGLTALSGARWKAIRSSEVELYDVAADPGEARDAARAHAQTAAAMARAAAGIAGAAPAASSAPSPEARDRLRALGYVSGTHAAADDDANAPNPAREIASWVAFERALTLLSSGRPREALPPLKALAARYPGARVFHATYARALQDTGDAAGAVRVYDALVRRWPGDALLFHDLAVAAQAAGDAAEALRAEQAALALDPANAAAWNGLGLAHAQAGRAADATRAFERAVARDPGSAAYWTNLGNARRDAGDLRGAADAYTRALERDARHADALNGQGVLLVQQRRAAEAIPFFERALARDDAHIEARLNLGIALQESGRAADAARVYREVIARARPGSREHNAAKALLGR